MQIANGTIRELNLLLHQSNLNHYCWGPYIIHIMELSRGAKTPFIQWVACQESISHQPAGQLIKWENYFFLKYLKKLSKTFPKKLPICDPLLEKKPSTLPLPCAAGDNVLAPHLTLLSHHPPRTSHILYISSPNILQKDIFGKLPKTFPKGSQFVTHL